MPPIQKEETLIDTDITLTSTTIISNLKKELKRLINQRAMYVASKLSGSLQDENLKNEEMKLTRIDNEISKFRLLQQKGENKLHIDNINSEFLVLNPNNKEFSIESLVNRLEGYRSSAKDKVGKERVKLLYIHCYAVHLSYIHVYYYYYHYYYFYYYH